MKVNYYLEKTGLIMASFSFSGKRLRLSTRDFINSSHWNQSSQQAVVSSQYDGRELNFKLMELSRWLINEHRRQTNDGIDVTPETIRSAYFAHIGKSDNNDAPTKPTEDKMTVAKYIPIMVSQSRYSSSRRGAYGRLVELLNDFTVETGCQVTFESINKDFYNMFVDHLQDQFPHDTSVGMYLDALKHVLNQAFEDEISQCVEQKRRYFVSFRESSDQVALSLDEIKKLYNFRMDDGEKDFMRRLLVIGCWTGLRYSDWWKYSPSSIVESGSVLKVFTQKTDELVFIPLHPMAKELLYQNFKSSFAIPTGVHLDYWIKRICQMAGIDGDVQKSYTSKGKRIFESRKKYEMVSCHTARRSFATNAILGGVSTQEVMKITGHRSERSFREYIRIDKLENAIRLSGHRFFTD